MVLADPGTIGFGGGGVSEFQARFGLSKQILERGAFYPPDTFFEPHEWYRLVTSGFLHFGIVHIAFNMILLYQLGQILEPRLGRTRFALLYFAALLAGSFGELLIGPGTGIAGGASGAVFGLMAAAAIGMWRQGVNIFTTGIGSLLILNLVLTFAIPGIAIGGHLGGAIGGALCGLVMLAAALEADRGVGDVRRAAGGRHRLRARQRPRRHLTPLSRRFGHGRGAAAGGAAGPAPGRCSTPRTARRPTRPAW